MMFEDKDFDRVIYNKNELSDDLNNFINLTCIDGFKFLKFMSAFPRTFIIYSNINNPDIIFMLAIKFNKEANFIISNERLFKYSNEKKDYINCSYNNLPASVTYYHTNNHEVICRFRNENGDCHNLNGPAYIRRKNNNKLICEYYIDGNLIDENEYNNRLEVIIYQSNL